MSRIGGYYCRVGNENILSNEERTSVIDYFVLGIRKSNFRRPKLNHMKSRT